MHQVLSQLLVDLSEAKTLADVNIAAGKAAQRLGALPSEEDVEVVKTGAPE